MTMEEMARIIGISRITLSKVMNNKDGVSEETRQREIGRASCRERV